MNDKLTDQPLAEEVKGVSVTEKKSNLDEHTQSVLKQVREQLRRKQLEQEVQTIIDEIFAEANEPESPKPIILHAGDDVLDD